MVALLREEVNVNNNILISIITVVRNGEPHIKKCLDSIASLKGRVVYEHIVVDGNSSDGTLDICRGYDCKVVIQQGRGIYNAMNLGINVASGDFILFSNADDFIDSDGIVKASDLVRESPSLNHLFSVRMLDSNRNELINVWNPNSTFHRNYAMPGPHPGMIIRREHLLGILAFNESFSSSSDYLMCLLLKINFDVVCHDLIISNFVVGGVSSSFAPVRQNIQIRNLVNLSIKDKFAGFCYDLYQYIRQNLANVGSM